MFCPGYSDILSKAHSDADYCIMALDLGLGRWLIRLIADLVEPEALGASELRPPISGASPREREPNERLASE